MSIEYILVSADTPAGQEHHLKKYAPPGCPVLGCLDEHRKRGEDWSYAYPKPEEQKPWPIEYSGTGEGFTLTCSPWFNSRVCESCRLNEKNGGHKYTHKPTLGEKIKKVVQQIGNKIS